MLVFIRSIIHLDFPEHALLVCLKLVSRQRFKHIAISMGNAGCK